MSREDGANPLEHSRFSEYIVLYTTDVAKKLKKWHDGKLRFFEFNRKIIVYSEQGQVVNTDFSSKYRQFEDGEEVALAGMTVQISVAIGSFERDISRLYNSKVPGGKEVDEQSLPKIQIQMDAKPGVSSRPFGSPYSSPGNSTPRRMIGLRRSRQPMTPLSASRPPSSLLTNKFKSPVPRQLQLVSPKSVPKPVLTSKSAVKVTPQKAQKMMLKSHLGKSPATPNKVALKLMAVTPTPRIKRKVVPRIDVPPPPVDLMSSLESVQDETQRNSLKPANQSRVEVCASDSSEEITDFEEDSNKENDGPTETVTYDFTRGAKQGELFTVSERFKL